MSYDIKCQDLADDFLIDHPKLISKENAAKLAQEIQDAIENWLEANGAYEESTS